MHGTEIRLIPTALIRVANPRRRNKVTWSLIVANIRLVGLKRPILIARRVEPDSNGCLFDLVCGQGRLEAFRELNEEAIPSVITDSPEPDQFLMSLVENIARRRPSNSSLFHEVRSMCESGYEASEIATKLGMQRTYVNGLVHLVLNGEAHLISQIEQGTLPISVAIEIANGSHDNVQRLLSEGYASGEFRGSKLKAIRRLVARRPNLANPGSSKNEKPLTSPALVKLYKNRISEQKKLIERANRTKDRLLVIVSAMRTLLADEDFCNALRAERLLDMPEQLRLRSL